MNKEEFVKEQMKLSKEDIIANYWYTYQDNVERLGIEHQLKLKDKEIKKIKKENEALNGILEAQRKRKYCSKFLKDFQKENGKNVIPDFDEIYKRYDDYKERISKAIDLLEEARENIDLPWYGRQYLIKKTINELKGVDKE